MARGIVDIVRMASKGDVRREQGECSRPLDMQPTYTSCIKVCPARASTDYVESCMRPLHVFPVTSIDTREAPRVDPFFIRLKGSVIRAMQGMRSRWERTKGR